MTREELKRYLDRFAYQTRHGTELAGDMVLQELWEELVPYCDVCGCTGTGLRTEVEVCRDCYDGGEKTAVAARLGAVRLVVNELRAKWYSEEGRASLALIASELDRNTAGAEELACDFDHPHPSHPCGRHVPEASTPCTCDKEYPCPACLARANDVLDAQRARHVGDDPKPEYIVVPALENARQKIQASADGGQVAVLTPAECREVGLRLTR